MKIIINKFYWKNRLNNIEIILNENKIIPDTNCCEFVYEAERINESVIEAVLAIAKILNWEIEINEQFS